MTPLRTVFGCDLRTLALVRICLGSVIIVDLINRALNLTGHYTDAGVLPRHALLETLNLGNASLHLVSGSPWIQAILFLLSGFFAFCLIVGYRANLAALLSWILLISLDSRNTFVSQGGDLLIRMLLFWLIFLPISARFAVDAALNTNKTEDNRYFSMATAGLLLQAASVYFFTALLKSSPVWLPEGTAVHYALYNDTIVTPFGAWFRQFDGLLQFLTYFVWVLELVTPLLLFSPVFHNKLRLIGLFFLINMHIGFYICLNVGLFPFISITSLLAFTTSAVWDWIEQRLATPERTGIKIYYDEPCTFCHKISHILRTFLLPKQVPVTPAQEQAEIYALMQEHDSWVVVDHQGNKHLRWDAIALVFRRSPIFAPLGWLFGLPIISRLGDRIYGWVAAHRGASWLSAPLVYRPLNYDLSIIANIALGVLLAIVLWLNMATLQNFPYATPDLIKQVSATLRLQQRWSMFAPAPTKGTGWYVAEGTLEDGSPVDIFLDREGKPTWKMQDYVTVNNENYRWRKFLARLVVPKGIELRPFYTDYLCREWNQSHNSKLASVRLHFFMQWTVLDGSTPSEPDHHLLWNGSCSDDPRDQVRALREGEIKTSGVLLPQFGASQTG